MIHGADYRAEMEGMWEARYRELEATLELIIMATAETLDSAEQRSMETPFKIRTISKAPSESGTVLTCVADGENLEYRFSVFSKGERLYTSPFQRSNTFIAEHSPTNKPVDEVLTEVRCNAAGFAGRTLSRKVDLK